MLGEILTGKEYFEQVQADVKQFELISIKLQSLEDDLVVIKAQQYNEKISKGSYSDPTADTALYKTERTQVLRDKQAAIANRLLIARMLMGYIGEQTNEQVEQVLKLRYLQGKSYREIAKELDTSTFTVRTRLDTG